MKSINLMDCLLVRAYKTRIGHVCVRVFMFVLSRVLVSHQEMSFSDSFVTLLSRNRSTSD